MKFRSTVRRAVLAAGVGALILAGAAPAAHAAPRDLQQVRNQVRDLQAQAESATERYNEAQGRLSDIQSDLTSLERKVLREKRQLGEISAAVDDLARSAYTSGGVDTSLQVLLADDPMAGERAALREFYFDGIEPGQSTERFWEQTRYEIREHDRAVQELSRVRTAVEGEE